MIVKAEVEQALLCCKPLFPGLGGLITRAMQNISIQEGHVTLSLKFGFPIKGLEDNIYKSISEAIKPLRSVKSLTIDLAYTIVSHAIQNGPAVIPQVKNTIAVASGKGGVGKSTVTVNLALALAYEGAKIGVLDADIYGPSLPWMLGTSHHPIVPEDKFSPLRSHDIQSISMGYLIQEKMPLIWRGPMASGALQQLCYQTKWDNLDYLFIDLPPGTGDIHLTLAQKIPVTGAIIVTTPQDIALLDAKRALAMFNKLHIPVLGVIENMASYHCPACGHEEDIFGRGGGESMSKEMAVPFLGTLPLASEIQKDTDIGKPTVVRDPEGKIGKKYRKIATHAAARLSLHSKNYAIHFPKVVVKTNQTGEARNTRL